MDVVPVVEGRVVIAAPVLLLLFGGDRFLAANLEVMRLAATGVDWGQADTSYLIRAQHEVARLNPCHEDNYYLANGLLTWGGAEQEGSAVLRWATECRFWDELPPFFITSSEKKTGMDEILGYISELNELKINR